MAGRTANEQTNRLADLDGDRLADLVAGMRAIVATASLEELQRTSAEWARRLLGAEGTTFVLRDDGHCHYVDEAAIAPLWKGQRFPMSECISGWVMMNRRPVRIEDVFVDERIPQDVYHRTFVKSMLMAPIGRPDAVGALGVYWDEVRQIPDHEEALAVCLADAAATTLRNLRLVEELRCNEERYRRVVEDQDEFIVRWRPGGVLTFVNPTCRRAFAAADNEELVGRNFFDLIPDDDRPRVRDKIAGLSLEGPEATDEHRVLFPDGTIGWQEWTDRAIFDDEGFLVEYQSVGRDISQRKELENRIAEIQRMEEIGHLAGGLAHDLNNLLTPVIGYGGMLRDDDLDAGERRRAVTGMLAAAERARDLLRQMLSFSRRDETEARALAIEHVIENFLPILRAIMRDDVRVETDLQPFPATVNASRSAIEQVLLNLAINAQDAMPDGGTLHITLRRQQRDEHDHAVLAVIDDGTGMPPDVAARVFTPFFTTKDPRRGTGLGLSTVRRIVEELGGTIGVDSAPGAGTRFEIYLPATPSGRHPITETVDTFRVARLRTGRILVVEDDAMVREVLAAMLERIGHQPVPVASCAAARLAADERGPFDAAVSDVTLEDGRGPELIAELRRRHPRLPVLFVSGHSREEVDELIGELETWSYLPKPFTTQELAHAIEHCFDHHG